MDTKEKVPQSDHLVANGRERVLKNNPDKDRICAEVKKRYADRLARAGFIRRIVLRIKIDREIEKEIDKLAPPDAMYSRTPSNDL